MQSSKLPISLKCYEMLCKYVVVAGDPTAFNYYKVTYYKVTNTIVTCYWYLECSLTVTSHCHS